MPKIDQITSGPQLFALRQLVEKSHVEKGEVWNTGTIDVFEAAGKNIDARMGSWAFQYSQSTKGKRAMISPFTRSIQAEGKRILYLSGGKISLALTKNLVVARYAAIDKLGAKKVELEVEFEAALNYLESKAYEKDAYAKHQLAEKFRMKKESPAFGGIRMPGALRKASGTVSKEMCERSHKILLEYKNMAIFNCQDIISEGKEAGLDMTEFESRLAAELE